MAKRTFFIGVDDKLDFARHSDRAVGATLDLSTTPTSGTVLLKGLKSTVSVNPGSITNGTELEVTATVTGAALGDGVIATPPAAFEASLGIMGAWVSATDTVKIRIRNFSASPIDPAAGNWVFTVLKA